MTKRLSDDEIGIDKIKHFLMDGYNCTLTPCSSIATVSTHGLENIFVNICL